MINQRTGEQYSGIDMTVAKTVDGVDYVVIKTRPDGTKLFMRKDILATVKTG